MRRCARGDEGLGCEGVGFFFAAVAFGCAFVGAVGVVEEGQSLAVQEGVADLVEDGEPEVVVFFEPVAEGDSDFVGGEPAGDAGDAGQGRGGEEDDGYAGLGAEMGDAVGPGCRVFQGEGAQAG